MIEHWKEENRQTEGMIKWSEFHYHLLSHLIDDSCPRRLAKNVELCCFPEGPYPCTPFLDACVAAVIESEGPEELNEALHQLVILGQKAWPHLFLR
jgi:hypothetical protein